jgi:hypothetical protein
VSLVGTTRDPDGRRVELTRERWEHIVRAGGHPELWPYRTKILDAVRAPDRRVRGREENEEWFFLAGVGPSKWLQVVVVYEDQAGRIITAFPRRAEP